MALLYTGEWFTYKVFHIPVTNNITHCCGVNYNILANSYCTTSQSIDLCKCNILNEMTVAREASFQSYKVAEITSSYSTHPTLRDDILIWEHESPSEGITPTRV